MSRNPRRFRDPVRLIVSVEAVTVASIDDLMKAGRFGPHGHTNRSEFVRLALERELRRCQSDGFRSSNAREGD
jgi:Arc/MetJ-type ribon-helix-helix transcriptional regulator